MSTCEAGVWNGATDIAHYPFLATAAMEYGTEREMNQCMCVLLALRQEGQRNSVRDEAPLDWILHIPLRNLLLPLVFTRAHLHIHMSIHPPPPPRPPCPGNGKTPYSHAYWHMEMGTVVLVQAEGQDNAQGLSK